MGGRWTVRLSIQANRDFRDILRWTAEHFGERQTEIYADILSDALDGLGENPYLPGSRARDEIGHGVRTLHISKFGSRARHLLIYRLIDGRTVEVGRIVHERMELTTQVLGKIRGEPEGSPPQD